MRALALWQTLVHEDRTMKPPPGRDYNAWEVANTDFLSGSTAMIWTSTAFLRYLEDNAKFEVGGRSAAERGARGRCRPGAPSWSS